MKMNGDRVNVLFVMFLTGMGGSERLVYNLALKLDRSRFNPSVAWFGHDEPLDEFKDLHIPLFHLPRTKKGVDFSVMQRLHRIISDNQIHVVNAQHFTPAIYSYYGCKIKENRPLTFTAHSEWEIKMIPWYWKRVGSYLINRMDASVGVTQKVTHLIQEQLKINVHKTVTIENGVDVDAFSPKHHVDRLRHSLGIGDTEKVIGVVANLKQVKNHRLLLQAFAKLHKSIQNVRLMLVGSIFAGSPDNTEGELRQLVNENCLADKVLFLGFRSDIAQLLSVMDVFCLTSLKEGLPLSLIEAMAAGLPVIGTNVEGIREVIVPNQNGLLVELGDIEGLTNALLRLLENPEYRERLGLAARKTAEEKYSLDRCVTEYEKLFLSTLPTSERYRQNKTPD